MGKKLSEMSLAELWELFPIFLTEHQDCWKQWYEEELHIIKNILPVNSSLRINHIGSTAIKGIWAKPIIDILIEIDDITEMNIIKEKMAAAGYICMSANENRVSLNKGYTETGFAERVFHIHLHLRGDNDELYFRDYLNENFDAAKEYEALKLQLWKQYEHDRDEYTRQKTKIVSEYTKSAKKSFGERYK